MTPKTPNLSNYKIPLSIFEATDKVIKSEQEGETLCKEIQDDPLCADGAHKKTCQERKTNFSYRFLF